MVEKSIPDVQIKHMVDRFLSWKLPENFNPDAGISFKAEFNENTAHPMRHEPSGTNLFDAVQAEAMVRHMLDGLPVATTSAPVAIEGEADARGETFTARCRWMIDKGLSEGSAFVDRAYRISPGGLRVLIADAEKVVGPNYDPLPAMRELAKSSAELVEVRDQDIRSLVIWSERLNASLATPPSLPEGVVPVVQADRERAWPYRPACYKDDPDTRQRWLDGCYDRAAPVIQAFADHRLAFSTPDNAEGMRAERHRFVRHADGGVYAVQGERDGKIGDGTWHPGFDYLCLASGMQFWTDRARFDERFLGLAWTQAMEDLLAEKLAALNSPGSPK